MEILRNILLVLHIVGFAGILGGVLMQMPKVKEGAAKINGAIMHSSWLMLVTGLGLVGMLYARDLEPDNMKIGVKTLLLVVILVLALVNKMKERVSAGVLGAIGGLAVVNVVLAVMW
ncbi:MAG: hypothetical protein GX862_08595 [Leucobacter sp.]|nr:hypothetical protein [Leucobacter sp.]